jgi:hypothetical protein
MKTIKVKTVKGDQQEITAANAEDLKRKLIAAFNFDPSKSVTITKPKVRRSQTQGQTL